MDPYQEYKSKHDRGNYDEDTLYTGPFWLGRTLTKVLSQNSEINYLSYLHDNAYVSQVEKRSEIDNGYRDAIIFKVRDKELADIMYLAVDKLGWISWLNVKIKKAIKNVCS